MPIKYTQAELKRARQIVASECGKAGKGACKVRRGPKAVTRAGKRKEMPPFGRITTRNGLLFRGGDRIDLPEADTVAIAAGFRSAEQFVRHLEGKR